MAFFKNSRVYHSLLQAVNLRSKVLNSKQFSISVSELQEHGSYPRANTIDS